MKIRESIVAAAMCLFCWACGSSGSSGGPAPAGGNGGQASTMGGSGGTHSTGGASAGSPSGGASVAGKSTGGSSAAGMTGSGGASGGAETTGGSGGTGGEATCNKCPTACCDTGSTCVDDGLGNLACKKSCTTSSQCPVNAKCCELLQDGNSVCAASDGTNLCRCTTGAECNTKACAPNLDAQSNPVGPYVCVANDGAAYHGCVGALTTCQDSGTCCFTDTQNNYFCATPCLNDSQCGAASCMTYLAKKTTCTGTLGCGPM
jgi:hypothetical protein